MAVIQNEANLSAGARGEAATVGERALTTSERARAEYAQFLQDTQNQSATAKGRAATAGIGAANVMQPQVAQSYQDMIGIEGAKGGIVGPAEAGLSAIGQIGSDIAFSELLKGAKPAATTPTSYEDLLSKEGTSSIGRLRDLTGADLEEELYRSRRSRRS